MVTVGSVFGLPTKGSSIQIGQKWAGLRFLKPMIFCFHFKHLLPGLHVVSFAMWFVSPHDFCFQPSAGGGRGGSVLVGFVLLLPPAAVLLSQILARLLHSAQQFVWDRFPELLPPLLTRFDSTRSVWRCSNKERTAAVRSAQLPLWGGGAERCRYGHKAQRGRWWRGGVLRSSWAVGQQQLLENSSGGSEPSAPGGAGTFVQTLTFLCLVNN